MNTIWMTYDRPDYEINKGFVTMFEKALALKYRNYEIKVVLTEELRVSVQNGLTQFLVNEKKVENPCFVIARSRDFRLSRMIERAGIRVFNSSFVCEICNDKAVTYQEVLKLGIPMMDTWFDMIPKDLEYPYVIKPVDGHGGNLVTMVHNEEEKKNALKELEVCDILKTAPKRHFVVQRPVSDLGKDVRVYVCGGRIIQAMLRTSHTDFRSNFCLGGSASLYELNDEERSYVTRLQKHFQFDFAGIDFIFDHGKAVFNEIEDVVGSRMLYSMTDIDIVKIYLDYMIQEFEEKEGKEVK